MRLFTKAYGGYNTMLHLDSKMVVPGVDQYAWIPNSEWKDLVSGQDIIVELAAGRFNDVSGLEIGLNEKNTDPDGSLNLGPDAYEQLMKKSEDISNITAWNQTDVDITGQDGFQATSSSGRVNQFIQTLDSLWYTTSFFDKLEVGGDETGYNIRHTSSESGNSTGITLSETKKLDKVTVLGRSGGGTVEFGFRDFNSSPWSKITLTDFQVTKSTYRLPYAPNDSAVSTLLVPSNNSGPASGYSYLIGADLLLSLFGTDGSDAKGELVATIIPQFSSGDIEADVNIFTANDEEASFFLYDDVNELLTAYDGTNTATVAFSPVAGTEYEIRLMYGDNTGSKMRVAVDALYGTEATFAGSLPNNTHLKFGYGSAWFKLKTNPQWFKEVQSSW